MVGNMRSRWTDFLTSDGEKPNRGRDSEFIDPPATRDALFSAWEDGWQCLFNALEPLSEQDIQRTVTIRGENHSVMQAINRQMAHYAYHIGQIVLFAKHFKNEEWKSLSVPRTKSGIQSQGRYGGSEPTVNLFRPNLAQDSVVNPVVVPPLLGVHLIAGNQHAEVNVIAKRHAG